MFNLLFTDLSYEGGGRCEKRKFTSRSEAVRFASKVRKGRAGGKQRPYQCRNPVCRDAGFWHLTKQTTSATTYYRDQTRRKKKR